MVLKNRTGFFGLPMKVAFGALLFFSPGSLRAGSVAHMRRKAPVREKKAYDTSVRAFSPDGSIYQVEYAMQAAQKGGLTIGVQTDKGLVLVAHGRRRSPLLKSSSVSKIVDIDACMCCAMSGLLPDGRLMVDHARTWVQEHWFEFDESPSVEAVAAQLSRLALKFNGYDKDGNAGSGKEDEEGGLAMSRPVGVALLVAGIDRGGRPVLYHLDPSGVYAQWRARAIGEKGSAAEAKLERAGPFEGMPVRRTMAMMLAVLKDVLGDDFSTDRLEMVYVDISNSGNDKLGDVAGDFVKSSDGGEGSSTVDEIPLSLGKGVDNSVVGRDSGDVCGRGDRASVLEAGSQITRTGDVELGPSHKGCPVSRHGYFRRVSKDEMEEMLADSEVQTTGANAAE